MIVTKGIVHTNQNVPQQGSNDFSASKTDSENRNIANLKQKKVPFSATEDNFIR